MGGGLIIEANIPVQELEGQRGEGAYFRRGLIFGRIRYYYTAIGLLTKIRIQNAPGLRYLMSRIRTAMLSETVVDRPDQFPHRGSPLLAAACKENSTLLRKTTKFHSHHNL